MLAIHDIIALRIIVKETDDCYAIMQTIHRLWKPIKKIEGLYSESKGKWV